MNERDFETLPVKRIFRKVVIPSLTSMLFSSMYIMADGIFVGRFVGSEALAAVNLVMPIVMICFALSDMIASGSSVRISIALGQKDYEKAGRMFSACMAIIFLLGIVFMAVGLFAVRPLVFFLVEDKVLAELASDYAQVLFLGAPAYIPMLAVDNYLRACGKQSFSMKVSIFISLLNIALDFLFLAVLGFGIGSAAFATVLSVFCGIILSLYQFKGKKLALYFTKPKIALREFGAICYNGSSEFFNSISISILAAAINAILLSIGGSIAVAAYGILIYIESLSMSIMYGIVDSLQSPVSYNIGAKRVDRAIQFFKICLVAMGGVSFVFLLLMTIFPTQLASVFVSADETQLIEMTKTAIYLAAPAYLFNWFNMTVSSFLTAFDKPKESLILMVFRSILFPAIGLAVLPTLFGVQGVFVTASASAVLVFVIAVFYAKRTIRG